jgi:dihydroorotate dehydrogenase electron transfer subunit
VRVLEHAQLARGTYRIRLACPEIARRVTPGQFIMLRLSGGDDPLLGRPLALYDTVLNEAGEPFAIDVVYLVVGKMTGRLTRVAVGDELEIWGPLGNGFAARSVKHLIMVAGGIGQTPFAALGREFLGGRTYGEPPRTGAQSERVTLCYGARSQDFLAGVSDFEQRGIDVRVSTDDGSAGEKGIVTSLLERTLDEPNAAPIDETHVVCCGPEPMLAAVARITERRGLSCEVSLETPMACGLGICFSCVTRVRDDAGDWDYRRTCVEGPIFDARRIVFDPH